MIRGGALLLAGHLALAASAPAVPEPDPLVRITLEAAKVLDRDAIWPGYRLLDQPVLLYDSAAPRGWLIGHPHPPAGFAQVDGLGAPVRFQQGALPGLTSEYYTGYDLDRVPSFVLVFTPGRDPVADAGTLVHERFHVFQNSRFTDRAYAEVYGVHDAENMALARLEQLALAQALRLRPGAEADRAAAMFVAVRATRNRLFGTAVQEPEDGLERVEGTADFVQQRTLAALSASDPLGSTWGEADVCHRLELGLDADRMARSRYYETGAAQCYLLDRAAPAGWRTGVEQGRSLAALMAAAYPVAPGKVGALVTAAKAELLGYHRLVEEYRHELVRAGATRAAAIHAFDVLPGFEVRIAQPPAGEHAAGFSSAGADYDLPGGGKLYPGMRLLDVQRGDFVLEVRDRPVVMQDTSYRFHVARNAVLTVDGGPVAWRAVTRGFRTLAIGETGVKLSATGTGTLRLEGRVLTIEWAAPAP